LPLGAEVPAKVFRLAQAAKTSADFVMTDVMLFNFMMVDLSLFVLMGIGPGDLLPCVLISSLRWNQDICSSGLKYV
jgi:hypothetical protein